MQDDKQKTTTPTGRPLQRISWDEKIAKKFEWFKNTADYYIHLSNFNFGTAPNARRDLRMLYQVYNNQFPLEWFEHFTDPLNASNPQHKKWPAKIRPTSMLRTNIDLLLGEYPKRPFVYFVQNMGEDAYNSYLDGMSQAIKANLQEHFLMVAQMAMAEAGHDFEQIPQQEEIPMPDEIKERFTSNYKDNQAIRGQRWLKRAVREYQVRQKFLKMFKDWLVTGRVYSYKNIVNKSFIYERVSPLEIDFDKSPGIDFIEDGEWVVRRKLLTISDVVDEFYTELTEADHESLERRQHWVSPFSMYNYLQEEFSKYDTYSGKIPVYHVVWKGKKEIIYAEYTDPETGAVEEMILDEDVTSAKLEGLKITKREWVNEIYETSRIGDNIFCRMRPIPVQRNEMNNFSACKLPYNGRHYSDTHSENISVLEMGLPYAIMYMVTNFTLEKTIAKNKGKIALFDVNAIPQKDGWDDEKFLYYADALGYMMLNRNQVGVDKSWNQYNVLDMSLFDQINQLIELRDSFKRDWDDLLGITAPRKGQAAPNLDGLGVQQNSLFQSSVITDMIFTLFEEFTERELQGFLDYSRFVNVDGVRAIYNEDEFDKQMLEIDPNSYCSAELGLFVRHSAEELQTLQQVRAQTQALLQNQGKMSTVLEMYRTNNTAELMAKLKRIEEIEMENAEAANENEHVRQVELQEIQEKFKRLESMLRIDEINAEWDRKDENTMLEGEYKLQEKLMGAQDGDINDNGIPDAIEITKRVISAQKIASDERKQAAQLKAEMKKHEDNMRLENEKLKVKREEVSVKRLAARKKPNSSK